MALSGTVALAFAVTALATSCQKAPPSGCASDGAALRDIIALDKRTGALLHEVDTLAVKGSPREAVAKIDREVVPAASHAKQQAEAMRPRTRWGAEQQGALVALIADRQKATAAYADALRTEVIQRVVEQMERQTDIERRAIKVEQSVLAVPAAHTEACAAL